MYVHLGYPVVIMGSVTIFSRSTIQQQRLACSFNAFTNTSFDAQNIVSELLPSPKAYQPWRTCQPVASGCQLKEKATDSSDWRALIKAPLNTNPTAGAGAIMCGVDLLNRWWLTARVHSFAPKSPHAAAT